jgi:anthranilate synthase component 1
LFAALTDQGKLPNTVLLDSAEPSSHQSQHSLLVVSAAVSFTCYESRVEVAALNSNGQSVIPFLKNELSAFSPRDAPRGFTLEFTPCNAEKAKETHAASPLSVLRTVIGRLKMETANHPESVLLIGLFAYDLVAQFEALPKAISGQNTPGDEIPDFRFVLADQCVAIDHLKRHAEVIVSVLGGANAESNYFSALDAVTRIADVVGSVATAEAEWDFRQSRPANWPTLWSMRMMRSSRPLSKSCKNTSLPEMCFRSFPRELFRLPASTR